MDFLPVPMDNYSALDPVPAKMCIDGFKAKEAACKTDAEKWAVTHEKMANLAALSASVQRGNAAILIRNARPLAGGAHVPSATMPLDPDRPDELF